MTAIARKLAFQVLMDVEGRGRYSNVTLQQMFRRTSLAARDKSLCTEIVYGTLQRKRSIDALLEPLSTRALRDLDIGVLTILRMTAYQLAFLSRIPSYAAIHDAVQLAKSVQPRAAGFVNAVLRAFGRDAVAVEQRLAEAAERCDSWADAVGVRHSYPTWLISRFEQVFGRERTLAIAHACNQPVSLAVRVNRLRADVDHVLHNISTQFGPIARASTLSPIGVRFERGVDVEQWSAYQSGQVTVQDEGAMLISPLLRVKAGGRVLDMCAGLGTKTTHIAELMGGTGTVDACDIHPHKLNALRVVAGRLGLSNIRPLLADARSLPDDPQRAGSYDAVLVDAPCSGFGVLRRRPEIRWRRTWRDVEGLTVLQSELLQAAARLVRRGGVIVYATCTLLPEENEDLVDRVVRDRNLGLTWDVLDEDLPDVLRPLAGPRGLLLTPERFGTDGFYMARLRKCE